MTKELSAVLSVDKARPALLMTLHSAVHAALESTGAESISHAEYRPLSGEVQMSYQVEMSTKRGYARKYSEIIATTKDFNSKATFAKFIRETTSGVASGFGTAIIDDNGVDIESHSQQMSVNFLRGLHRVGASLFEHSRTRGEEKHFFSLVEALVKCFDTFTESKVEGAEDRALNLEIQDDFALALHGVLTFPAEGGIEAWKKYQESHDSLSPVWLEFKPTHQISA